MDEERKHIIEEQARVKLSHVRERLMQEDPLYGFVCSTREHVLDWSIPTACTNGKRVKWNPGYVDAHDEKFLLFLHRHEFWHVLKCDPLRFHEPEHNMAVANVAADKVINYLLDCDGHHVPEGLLFDYNVRGKDTEQVYAEELARLQQQAEGEQAQEQAQAQGQGEGEGDEGDSQCEGNAQGEDEGESAGEGESVGSGDRESEAQAPGNTLSEKISDMAREECAEGVQVESLTHEDGSALTETEKQEEREAMYREVSQALRSASRAGKVTQDVKVRIEKEMEPTRTAREVLTRFFQDALRKSDYTYRRPNKRYADQGLYLPSLRNEEVDRVCAIIDVSGSVSDTMVRAFCAEMREYLDALGQGAELTVLYVSDVFCGSDVIQQGEEVALTPTRLSCGTSYVPGFKWIREQGAQFEGVVYYTDGYCDSFPKMDLDPQCPVVWCLHPNCAELGDFGRKIHFGEVIVMDEKAG